MYIYIWFGRYIQVKIGYHLQPFLSFMLKASVVVGSKVGEIVVAMSTNQDKRKLKPAWWTFLVILI